jgi:hypothetical protein
MQVQTARSEAAAFAPAVNSEVLANASDIVLRHLVGSTEIASVEHLRGEIDLSVHATSGQTEFARLEKKETSWVLSSPSTSRESALAPFGSSQWAMPSP